MSPRLLFIGAGAIGSYLGGFLSRAGHEVTLVDPWPAQVEAIRAHGISVSGPHEPFEAWPTAMHTPRVESLAKMLTVIDGAKATDNLWGERWSPSGYEA